MTTFKNSNLIMLINRVILQTEQARAIGKVDNAIYRINHYPVDSVACFVNTYLLDSELSGG